MKGMPVPVAPQPHAILELGLQHCGLFQRPSWRQKKAGSPSYAPVVTPVQQSRILGRELNGRICRAAVSGDKLQQARHTSAVTGRNGFLQQPVLNQEASMPSQCMAYHDPKNTPAHDLSKSSNRAPILKSVIVPAQQHVQQAVQQSMEPASGSDGNDLGTSLWPVSDAGEIEVQVDDSSEDTSAVQQLHSGRRHHRHRSSHASGHLQSHRGQQGLQQQWQPDTHSPADVDLLQHVVLVRSWSAALHLLQQHPQLKQAHVALLWWQLQPELQAREKAAVITAAHDSSRHSQKVQSHLYQARQQKYYHKCRQQVLLELCRLTQQVVNSMTPQSLAFTLQGLAAAIRAGDLVLEDRTDHKEQKTLPSIPAVTLSHDMSRLLWCRLLTVAGSCTAQQLTRCLSAGRQLGWHLSAIGQSAQVEHPSSSWNAGCCWPILEAACRGQLAEGCEGQVQQRPTSASQQQHSRGSLQRVSCSEAGELLAAITALFVQDQQQQLSSNGRLFQQPSVDRSGWQQQYPLVHQVLYALLKQASAFTASSVRSYSLGQGVTYMYAPGSVATRKAVCKPSALSSDLNNQQQAAAAAVLQSAAVLGLSPGPGDLEQLVHHVEPWLRTASVSSVLQVLQALTDLQVEPWQSWMTACLTATEAQLHVLSEAQLLQLLSLLPQVSTVQPSQQLLQKLARLTAKYCCRYSWTQLAVLPGRFAALQYTPPALWMKDYLAATSVIMHQQQQQWSTTPAAADASEVCQKQVQMQQQHAEQVQLYAQMLTGMSLLGPPGPPAAWLSLVESLVLLHLQQLRLEADSASCQPSAAAAASHILHALQALRYEQSQQLLVMLGACTSDAASCQQDMINISSLDLLKKGLSVATDDVSQDRPATAAGSDVEQASCSSSSVPCEDSSSTFMKNLSRETQSGDVADSDDNWHQGVSQHANDHATEIPAETDFCRNLGKLALPRSGFELLVDGRWDWKHQRVCVSSSSKRLGDWGVLLKQGGALLATL